MLVKTHHALARISECIGVAGGALPATGVGDVARDRSRPTSTSASSLICRSSSRCGTANISWCLSQQDQPKHRAKVLISRHRDGEINAIAAERLGIGTIRGSGDQGGGLTARAGSAPSSRCSTPLQRGYKVAMTADVPKIARVAGKGIVQLAPCRGGRSFRSRWRPAGGSNSRPGIARHSTCRSAVSPSWGRAGHQVPATPTTARSSNAARRRRGRTSMRHRRAPMRSSTGTERPVMSDGLPARLRSIGLPRSAATPFAGRCCGID